MTSDDESPSATPRFDCFAEWQPLIRTQANVLVHGNSRSVNAFVNSIRPALKTPVVAVVCGPGMTLESTNGSVLLKDVDRLDVAGQQALLNWVRHTPNRDVQLVALTHAALFPRVENGTFDADLYYVLNTIYVDLTQAALSE